MQKWRGSRGVCSAGVGGTPESPHPPAHPNLNLAPPVHHRAPEQLSRPGPQSRPRHTPPLLRTPRAQPPPIPYIGDPCRAVFPQPWVRPRRRPVPSARARPRGSGALPGSIDPAPGAGRGLWGSRRRRAFGFQVNGTSRKTLPGPLSPARQPKGFIPAARSPRTATCRDSRAAGRAGLRRRRSPGAGLLRAAARGGEAGARLSVPERGAQPRPARRGGGAGPRRGAGPGRSPGRGPGEQSRGGRGAGPRDSRTRCKALDRRLRDSDPSS